VAQDEVLQGELAVAAPEEGKRRSRWSRKVIINFGFSPDQS
jgi:hypothetical protein